MKWLVGGMPLLAHNPLIIIACVVYPWLGSAQSTKYDTGKTTMHGKPAYSINICLVFG
ncbi:hypothetical protein SLEP1_g37600 [Rubroshorea leprosula]|uniref:Uncharacterized protein n=1 Tax=Rubroshorea leprosula TaxID=152421 RepID=A0AAV5KVJ2_9ROSI|nr:hypothetical protein SLEP1_g37600 [Rubroshorea leprosula]